MNAAMIATPIPDDATLEDCEEIVKEGEVIFVKVGLALLAIKNRELYRSAGFDTWTAYLKERGPSRAHASRQIKAAHVFELVAGVYGEENIPPHERTLRDFASKVPPEAQLAVWGIISQTAPAGVVTTKHIELVVNVMKEVVITQAVEDGNGSQMHVSQALKAQITKEVYENYKQERNYNDAVATPPLYQGRGVVTELEGSRVTLELEANPDVLPGQLVRVYLNIQKG